MRKFQVLASCRRGFLNARDREIKISTSNSQALRYASLTDELLASRMTSCIAFNRYITNGSCYLRPKITSNSGDPRTSEAGGGASLLVDPGPEEGNTRDTATREMGRSDKRSPRSSLRRANTQADLKFYSSSAKADFIQGLLKEFSSSKGNPLSAFPKSTPEVFGESDDFGSVAGRLEPAVYEEDEKDEERLALLPPHNQQELQNQYTESIQALCDEGKFADALALLEEEMPSKKVRPIPYHYRLLIGAAAKLGLADTAFDLFSQLVRHGHTPKPLLYSYLFIACANDAHPTRHAPRIMRHIKPNIIIMVNLAKTAVSTNQYDYSAKLVSWVKQHRIRPNATFIELMEEARARAKQDLKDMENDVSASSRQKARQRRKFLATYSLWLRSAPLASAQTNDKQKHARATP
ncbi:uncharacterized protein LOC108678754 [Hyalella azteca]|uniref:Uncharacterized protein LOC108678754 n=1 Tax=Hyalella azteca TaxID=294128 RepID=A0A8B7P976_HYAAZ|nr:uncharacterized protein LOC108678754 [Hyalella azteca]